MQHLHREKWRMQSYAVLEMQTRLLLDVHGRLENSRQVLRHRGSYGGFYPPVNIGVRVVNGNA